MSKQTITESRPRPGPAPYWLGAGRRDIVGWILLRIGRALDEDWAPGPDLGKPMGGRPASGATSRRQVK